MTENKIIISIGRQFGSGGRVIGRMLAEYFNIPYYDKELIKCASEDSGIKDEFFKSADERQSGGLLSALNLDWSLGSMFVPSGQYNLLSGESLFKFQSETIKRVAQNSCVIVGRCANYVLRDDPALFSVFITADIETRVKRVLNLKEYDIKGENIESLVKKADKSRASYYNYYSNTEWGVASTYDLCINSSVCGIEKTAEIIADVIKITHFRNKA